jgi:hypothetical protein
MAMFTTIAAATSLAATAATTGMSFAQAGKQRKLMRKAEAEADAAMQQARKKLEVNQFDKLAINKEPYELAREALLAQGAQGIQAGVESERGAAATAGRIQMAQQEGQAAIRGQMGQEMQQLEMLSAQEDARLQDIGVQLDLEEVAGAQLAAANAQELAANATAQGMEGLTSLGSQLAEKAPLFEKNRAAEQKALGNMSLNTQQFQDIGNISQKGGLGAEQTGDFTNLDLQAVSKMSPQQYRKFRKALTPTQRQLIFGADQFQTLYNQYAPVTSLSR